MKTMVLVILVSLGMGGLAMAQDESQINENLDKKTLRKYQKIEKREQQKMEDERRLQQVKSLIDSREFVLEANYLSGRSGVLIPVTSNLNFIMVDSAKSVIQIGSPSGIGYNGVGGVTDEGKVTKYEVKETKGGYSLKLYTSSSLNSFTIFFTINSDGHATARLSGVRGGVLTYHGDIVPVEESFVYQGQTTY